MNGINDCNYDLFFKYGSSFPEKEDKNKLESSENQNKATVKETLLKAATLFKEIENTKIEGNKEKMKGITGTFINEKTNESIKCEFWQIHGTGTFTRDNGDKISGGWKGGIFCNWDNGHYILGSGRWTFPQGIYKGEFKRGLEITGKGCFSYNNGDSYIGEWKDNQPNGIGTYYFKDGGVLYGEWKDGEFIKKLSTQN